MTNETKEALLALADYFDNYYNYDTMDGWHVADMIRKWTK